MRFVKLSHNVRPLSEIADESGLSFLCQDKLSSCIMNVQLTENQQIRLTAVRRCLLHHQDME